MKRLISLLLALTLAALLCACGAQPQPVSYPLTVNGTPLDGELFTYFLDQAAGVLPEGTQEEQINYAVQLCIHYVAVNSAFARAGVPLTPAEKKETDDETNVQWNLYERYYTAIGVSRQTFSKVRRSERSREKLREIYFGEAGASPVPEEQLRDYLEAAYVSFRVIRIPKKTLDVYGNEVDRDEAQTAALNEKIAAGLAAVNENGTGIESVFATFVSDRNGDREEYAEVVTDGADHAYPAEFVQAVRAVPVGKAAVLDYDDALYLVYREDIRTDEDVFEAYKDECLAGLTEDALRAQIDEFARNYASVKDQPALAACWNDYRNARAKAGKTE